MTDSPGSLVITGWIVFACFGVGLLLCLTTVVRLGRTGRGPSDDARTRRRVATRAVTALTPLAVSTVAVALALIGDAGWRYRTASGGDGGPPPHEWAFAASPGFGTAMIAGFVVIAALLLGAVFVFHSPPKIRPAPADDAERT